MHVKSKTLFMVKGLVLFTIGALVLSREIWSPAKYGPAGLKLAAKIGPPC